MDLHSVYETKLEAVLAHDRSDLGLGHPAKSHHAPGLTAGEVNRRPAPPSALPTVQGATRHRCACRIPSMDATITHGAALLFAGTFPPPDGLRARTASKRRLKSRQGAAFPRRFIRPSSALAQRSAHPSFNSRLALRRLVVLAGSKTIDKELTDDFKDINGASLARCGSHLELVPALEPCAPLAHLLTCPSCGSRNPPPFCTFAATGRHYRSWSTAADFLALLSRFSSCRSPRTTPPRAHGSLWPPLFYETAVACFWWWAYEPPTWGDVCLCPCLT